jgi:hypothetical protein
MTIVEILPVANLSWWEKFYRDRLVKLVKIAELSVGIFVTITATAIGMCPLEQLIRF